MSKSILILEKKQWLSKNGFIDISTINTQYILSIYTYWFKDLRPKIEDKINRSNIMIKKTPNNNIKNILIKNRQRVQIIQLYDNLINSEIRNRNLWKLL